MRARQKLLSEAERRFPVRVRVAMPPGGFGRQLRLMHDWLDETCGAERWTLLPSGHGAVNDAIAFYFEDAAFADAFVARFCCGHRVESVDGAFVPRTDVPVRRVAAAHKTP
ncbi:MAG TPA: hypothetical protein VGR91_04125 [Stellaceae bacterium]|nr:hypothetical protein [Stellaceae bacterium]